MGIFNFKKKKKLLGLTLQKEHIFPNVKVLHRAFRTLFMHSISEKYLGILFFQQNGYIQTDEYEIFIDHMRHTDIISNDVRQHKVKICSIPKGTTKA